MEDQLFFKLISGNSYVRKGFNHAAVPDSRRVDGGPPWHSCNDLHIKKGLLYFVRPRAFSLSDIGSPVC